MADDAGPMLQRTSAFLQLPAELRNRIYQLLFESSVFDIRTGRLLKVFSGLYAHAHAHVRTPGLLLASKQVYTEAINFYYELSTFSSGWVPDLGNWLKGLSSERQMQLCHLRYRRVDTQLFPLTKEKRESLTTEYAALLVCIQMYMGSIGVTLDKCMLETGHRFGRADQICSSTVLDTSTKQINTTPVSGYAVSW